MTVKLAQVFSPTEMKIHLDILDWEECCLQLLDEYSDSEDFKIPTPRSRTDRAAQNWLFSQL